MNIYNSKYWLSPHGEDRRSRRSPPQVSPRYGVEEFTMLLLNTGNVGDTEIAQKLWKKFDL